MAFNELTCTMECSSGFALEASSLATLFMASITSSLVMAVSLSVYDPSSDELQESVL